MFVAAAMLPMAQAQQHKMGMHTVGYKNILPEMDSIFETYAVLPSEIENSQPAIVKDFLRRCKDPASIRWYKMPKGGYSAKYTCGDAWYRINYDSKGEWVSGVRIYHTPRLPGAVKDKVEYAYSGYNIIRVEEISYVKNIDIAYVIHMQDKDGDKVICFCNGRMDTLDDTASK
jgi:hypothetical protein